MRDDLDVLTAATPRRPYVHALIAFALMGGATQAAMATTAPCPASPYRSDRPMIIAHASGTYFGPPNTIEMMRAAVAAGADVVDADVRTTIDGVLVASHDDAIRVDATHTVSIARSTYAQVRRVDLGNTWTGPKHDRPLAGRGVRVPTIDAILRAFPGRRVGLEFKTTGGEETMCTLLRVLHRTADAFVSSAGDAAVDRFKPLCPEVTTTVTDAMVVEFQQVQAEKRVWCAPVTLGQPPLAVGTFRLTRADVLWDHAHGLADFTWTADDVASLKAAVALGVDGVYTARPDLARAIFRR